MASESELVDMAKLAEQAERYDDMVKFMTELTEKNQLLTDEQRNLLSVAFKNVVGARRSAWRIISSMEARYHEKGDPHKGLASNYRQEIGRAPRLNSSHTVISYAVFCLKKKTKNKKNK